MIKPTNIDQITSEARKEICRMFDKGNSIAFGDRHDLYFPAPEEIDAIIKSAIETAIQF